MGTKPFDLAAALESWSTSAPDDPVPEFKGKPKRKEDPTVVAWLDLVEKGCSARRVPKAHWPDVAKHFMAKKARGRVVEVEKVMRALHGEQWGWTWKDFRVAVLNMGWNIDEKRTREVKVERKTTGLWRIVAGNKEESSASSSSVPPPPATPPKSSGSKILASSPKKTTAESPKPTASIFSSPPRSPSVFQKEKDKEKTNDKNEKKDKEKDDKKDKDKSPKPTPPRSSSLFSLPTLPFLRPAPQPEQTMLEKISAQVPLWLLAATETLATLANDNPDVVTAVATALVAVGTISGGGSAAVAAVGEAAVVVGRAVKSAHDRIHNGGGSGQRSR